jgi:hypothetical protein
MHVRWKLVHRELRDLLKEPLSRSAYAQLRQSCPTLHRWPQAHLVSSFLSRRTPPLELRMDVARLLVAAAADTDDGARVAGTILVLAGALVVSRMGRRGGPPPASAFVFIFNELPALAGSARAVPEVLA